MITMGLNAVATLMQDGGWRTVVWIAEMLGILFCAFTYLRSHDLKVMFAWGLTFTLVTALLITPRVTVIVNDLTAPENIGRVDNVPAGLAFPLYLITGTGYTLATAYEDSFHFPDERAYTRSGMMFAAKLMQDSFTIDSRDPVLAFNLVEYTKNCVVPDIMLNHKYSYQEVMASEDVQSVIFSQPSPLRGIYWRDASGSLFMFCREAAPKLRTLLQTESSSNGTTFMSHAVRMLPGNKAPQTVYADQLVGSYNYFFSSSRSAQAIMLQNIAVAGLRRGMNSYMKGMNDTASMVDIASETSLMKLRLSHAVSYAIATEVLPQLHTVLLLFSVCIFPVMVLALYIREIAWPVCRSYLNFMGSLMLWPIMFAIFNFAVNFGTQHSFHSSGPTLSNMNRLMETSSTTAGIAGWLMMSIPFLAFRLFTALGSGFASLSSSLGSALSSAASADSSAVASGNLSAGNVQVDNINGFKTNLNHDYRAGMATQQLANGALESHTTSGQTVFDTSGAISRLPVDLHLDRHLASAAQQMTRDSVSQTASALQGYNHSLQKSGSQLKQFHEQFGNSDTKTLSASTGMSITDAEKISRMQNVAEDYATRNHISLNQAYSELEDKSRSLAVNGGVRGQVGMDSSKALWGRAGEWVTGASVKGDIHSGIELSGRTGSHSQTTESGSQGQDNSQTLSARESLDFSRGMDVLRNYSLTWHGQHVDNNAAGLMHQISSGITTSDSQYQQYTTSQSHTHELQRMASETETLSAGARENYNQQFVAWVSQRAPDSAQAILTNTTDAGVAKQREEMVQAFVQEQLQGRVAQDYASHAGRTGQGMDIPPNIADAQFGQASDEADKRIDTGSQQHAIRTDVKKDVDAQHEVVKNMENYTKVEIAQGDKITGAGFSEQQNAHWKSEEKYSENKKAADEHQQITFSKPWVSKSYKDYIERKDD
jgi:conjugal transfer mating pair stabilization protein TraG